MTFTVTYRGADGALREERIEAANRAECFAQMKAQGIAPLSVKEGDSVSRRGRRDDGGRNGRAERADRVECKAWKRHATVAAATLILMAIVGGGVVSAVLGFAQSAFGPVGIVATLAVCIAYLFALGAYASSRRK